MKYRKLGRTGLDVSLICLGTMTWGNQNTERDGHEQMDYALDQGVNFFDTAEMYAVPPSAQTYGATEKIIGSWFAARKNREKIILASKIAGPGLGWVRNGQNKIDRKNILAAVEGSLKRLQTERHWDYNPHFDRGRSEDNFLDVLRTCDELIKAGKIRHIGLSNETAWGTMKYLSLAEKHNLPRMQSIQNEYSLLSRLFEPDLHEIALAEDCGLLAWSPLARGLLSGKYLGGKRPKGTRLAIDPRPEKRDTPQANAAIEAYIKIARKYNLDACQMALAFVNSRPFVTSNIIGATTVEQLKTNIDSVHINLSKDIILFPFKAALYQEYPKN